MSEKKQKQAPLLQNGKKLFFKKFIFNISARAVTTFCDDRI